VYLLADVFVIGVAHRAKFVPDIQIISVGYLSRLFLYAPAFVRVAVHRPDIKPIRGFVDAL
jgi:hypothetical protein